MATRAPEPVSHEATWYFKTLILSGEIPGSRGGRLPEPRAVWPAQPGHGTFLPALAPAGPLRGRIVSRRHPGRGVVNECTNVSSTRWVIVHKSRVT
jgi:hypothetical protein